MSKQQNTVSWIAQVIAAVILGQTLFYKFGAAEESIQIFEKLGAEPWGRIGSGVVELIAVVLLLSPRLAAYGAVLGMGVMAGAIGAHLTKLGIDFPGGEPTLFILALVTFACCALVAFLRRTQLFFYPGAATTNAS